MRIEVAGQTDVGRVRRNNEDAFRIESDLHLYVLSDGMGGEAHGEIASALAVETVVEHCREAENGHAAPLMIEPDANLSETTNRLASAVTAANQRIFQSAAANPAQRGMGATVVAVQLDGERISVVHVGDSRVYLLHAGNLEQLTADHSLVAEQVRRGVITPQEAETSTLQSVLIRALGARPDVQADAEEKTIQEGDALLLCSDGLTRMVTDPEIASTLLTFEPAQAAADHLVELANEYGGADNITVIVVRALADSGVFHRLKEWTKATIAEKSAEKAAEKSDKIFPKI